MTKLDLKIGDRVRLVGVGWEGEEGVKRGDVVTVDGCHKGMSWSNSPGVNYLTVWGGVQADDYEVELVERAAPREEEAPKVAPASEAPEKAAGDPVNHPTHYISDPSGIECIQVTRHRNFNVGNAIKYLWRAGLKGDTALSDQAKEVEDLRKAIWYITDEIQRLEQS